MLGCKPHDIPILVANRLLKPLGNPPSNSTKYYATTEIMEFAKDRAWLSRATNAMSQYWKHKNLRRLAKEEFGTKDDVGTSAKNESIGST